MTPISFREFASRIFYSLKPQPNQVDEAGKARLTEEIYAELLRSVEEAHMKINFDMINPYISQVYYGEPRSIVGLQDPRFRELLEDLLDQQDVFDYEFIHANEEILIVSHREAH